MSKDRNTQEIIAHIIGRPRNAIDFDRCMLSANETKRVTSMKARVDAGEPLAYVLGFVDFFNVKIYVGSGVLIPRLETELLVEHALKDISGGRVLDLCSGSGAIGFAIKKERPKCDVVLADISKETIAWMELNRDRNRLDVRIVQSDLLENLNDERFDFIMCNPPYIRKSHISMLEASVVDHEPTSALDGGEDGLMFYRKLADSLPAHLKSDGKVFFEIGYDHADEMRSIFLSDLWENLDVIKDLAGHDRFFTATRKERDIAKSESLCLVH